jgi:hypothetical protein
MSNKVGRGRPPSREGEKKAIYVRGTTYNKFLAYVDTLVISYNRQVTQNEAVQFLLDR